MKDTEYFVNDHKQIIGPSGPTGIEIDNDEYLVREGKLINVYLEDGYFYRCGKKLFFLFRVCGPTGHFLTKENKIVGPTGKLPWQRR